MLLALGLGDRHEIVIQKTRGVCQNGTGNVDLVVISEGMDDPHVCILYRRQPFAQFDEGFALDLLNQETDDVIKQFDLTVGQSIRIVKKQISDAPQDLSALSWRATEERILNFG